ATPSPSPVEPRRSRDRRASVTLLRSIPWLFSKRRPACSKSRFLLVTERLTSTLLGASSREIRFICTRPTCERGFRTGPDQSGDQAIIASAARGNRAMLLPSKGRARGNPQAKGRPEAPLESKPQPYQIDGCTSG